MTDTIVSLTVTPRDEEERAAALDELTRATKALSQMGILLSLHVTSYEEDDEDSQT